MTKLWGGRFTKETNELVEKFTASISFDQKLALEDIEGSLAHVQMLGECGIITMDDVEIIKQGLQTVEQKIINEEVQFSVEDEDIHMNIERLLIEEVGPVGGKLHTGRSRNDQVATDMHLYLRKQTSELIELVKEVQNALLLQAKENIETIMPGYTHLQRAQPILFSHHLLAYFWMFERDKERLIDSLKRINWSPLGAGALAGTTFPIDRNRSAELLGFDTVYPNSLDAVSDRDFILEFLSIASIMMIHISRISEELVIWSSQEYQFVELDDSFCTGSSIMPQKKNPDVPELLRGKTGRVYGNLIGLLTVLKGLPLAYNKDMQEDKEGMLDTVETLNGSLRLLAPMIETMTVNKEQMFKAVTNDYSNATDIADYLVTKGLPFRQAHEIIGKIVLYAIQHNKYLLDLSLLEYQSFNPLFEEDIFNVLQPKHVVEARNSLGGTSSEQVKQQIVLAEGKLS
ncbi:argininosuccinate lyase [Heyndrickxia sporothermodurans]|uniref:Argininosuccinate lyase n=1 Tax=Heyndrickxia sporothermodurans TaxID=46224 RepID=A0AB37H871_9BACI|nr:argininosuccinate lyase [Heyndrickxia sporothermodurans]MBL5771338.1 argininosuccinate lyase [Heyndrickxia sporothermodurans]MBL5775053.1 argininosuccinate lyase [Heyndrickxia sporothermodurans]MBL5792468.1 argininosuccinate lyase [Heyndrickxia sporothermodurans]MBL5796381.1 argininosuccinate lyase [Heyndrickxia sporothermodurans]MBL5807345.1 argininosuccinate lyase [Heyndrickxia sporothermodurans]